MTPAVSSSRAVERQFVEDLLRAVPKGETVSRAALTEALDAPFARLRHVVHRVRQELAPDGFVFEAVIGDGLRRLTDAEIAVAVPNARRRRIHNQARRGVRELAALDHTVQLTDAERMSALIGRSLLGTICVVTTRKAVEAIAENVARTGLELPLNETIEAFRRLG